MGYPVEDSDRSRVRGQIQAWCDGAMIEGVRRELSDTAAVLIAGGRLGSGLRARN